MDRNDILDKHFRKNYNRLVAKYAQKYGHHNAEDIVQSGYERALRWFNFDPKQSSFNTWFEKVTDQAKRYAFSGETVEELDEELMPSQELHFAPAAEKRYELSEIGDLLEGEEHRDALIQVLVLGY